MIILFIGMVFNYCLFELQIFLLYGLLHLNNKMFYPIGLEGSKY